MGCLLSRNPGVQKPEEFNVENLTQINAAVKQNMPNTRQKKRRQEDGKESNRPSKSRRSGEMYQVDDDWNRMQDDIQRYKSKINDLENRQRENTQKIDEYREKLQSTEKETSRLRDKLAKQKEDMQKIEGCKAKLQSTEKENTRLREKLEKQKDNEQEKNDYKAKLQSAEREITSLQEKLTEANKNLTRMDALKKEVETLTKENDELRTRLSAIVGANLTNNNPNIADLSDMNRPTKLAERYTELYDHEWTDSLSAMMNSGISELDGLNILRDIITEIYKLCENTAERCMRSVLEAMKIKYEKLPVELTKGLKEVRKKNYKNYLPELTKEMDTLLKNRKAGEETKLYKSRCLELCWLMCIQDPPVYMDCDIAVHECLGEYGYHDKLNVIVVPVLAVVYATIREPV